MSIVGNTAVGAGLSLAGRRGLLLVRGATRHMAYERCGDHNRLILQVARS